MEKKSVLVVAAHPDDEILGAGGAIARHIEEGDSVAVLILGEGIASRSGISGEEVKRQQDILYADMRAAHSILGTNEPILKTLPDNAFDSVPLLSVVHEIEKVIQEVHPSVVYTHHAGDVNIDHRITSQAVEAATRPMQDGCVMEVRQFEIASSSEWNFTKPAFRPNLFLSLSEDQLHKKIAGMEAYKTEIREFPHPRSSRYLESLARIRGGQSGFGAAEAYEVSYRRLP